MLCYLFVDICEVELDTMYNDSVDLLFEVIYYLRELIVAVLLHVVNDPFLEQEFLRDKEFHVFYCDKSEMESYRTSFGEHFIKVLTDAYYAAGDFVHVRKNIYRGADFFQCKCPCATLVNTE